ncbi:hypothetical protein DMENIID0001_145310 [Sergentomyia squamirostris]
MFFCRCEGNNNCCCSFSQKRHPNPFLPLDFSDRNNQNMGHLLLAPFSLRTMFWMMHIIPRRDYIRVQMKIGVWVFVECKKGKWLDLMEHNT